MACSIEDNWDSVQTQTDQINNEEIRRVVQNIREGLTQLEVNNEDLCSGLRARMVKLSQLEDNLSSMSATMAEFSGTMSKIWGEIEEYRSEGRQLDQEIHALQEEKDILDEEESSLVDQLTNRIGIQEDKETDPDPTEEERTELQLKDYARCDLYRKLRCLKELKDASQKLKTTYQQEWDKIREDMKSNHNEARHYERQLQNLQNTAVVKMGNLCLNPDNKQDQEILELITYLEMKRDMRDMNEDTLDLQVQTRDFENELTELQETRKELLEENYALDPEEEDEPGVAIHRTGGRTDLYIRFDQSDYSDDEWEYVPPIQIGGKHLHTCIRKTSLAVPVETWTVEELEELKRLDLKSGVLDAAQISQLPGVLLVSDEPNVSEEPNDEPNVSEEPNVSDGSDVSDEVIVEIEILDDKQQEIESKKETKKEAISKDTMAKLINESDILEKQMDEIATGSGGLLTRLRARMGIQAHSGTSLRPKAKADAAPRRFSLKDSAKAFFTIRQRRNTPDVSNGLHVSHGSDVSDDEIDSKRETKKGAITNFDLPEKQMDEIATGSGGLLTKLRARMGIQAHSGTSLRPKVKADAAPRRFSLKDSAKAIFTKRQRRK